MTDSFLGNVAADLYGRFGDGISSLNILFPNRRSQLFFMDELSKLIDKPLWQPRYVSVDELMERIAGMERMDGTRAVVELYKVWRNYHEESFDRFYAWGEMLLADFDQLDKYMVDAKALFTNIRDIKEITSELGYLDEEQRRVVMRFWDAFSADGTMSEEKERFHYIWNTLLPVYNDFRSSLAERGMAYTGMIHRTAAEKLSSGGELPDMNGGFAVVGFNALSACEKVLFEALSKEGADFFWDWDDYYAADPAQEAGLFVRENIKRYPQPGGFVNPTSNFARPKNITAVSLPSDSMQCKYAAEFLDEIISRQGFAGKETAIVLTDEELLVPLLFSIPESVENINVTMGYPLRQTLAYSFVERLLKLQGRKRVKNGGAAFYHADVTGLLSHPYILAESRSRADSIKETVVQGSKIYVPASQFAGDAFLEAIFDPGVKWDGLGRYITGILSAVAGAGITDADTYDGRLQREFFGEIAQALRKLYNSLENCGVEMNLSTVSSLARRMLQNVRIPFSGEPLRGVQVMGILETRNLDFDNVLILSMNDDNFPGNPAAISSFIPYNLRFAYGLPTPQHHDGVYAYYFYRLLQRAGHIVMGCRSTTNDESTGEPSRYIYQLEYESPHSVVRENVNVQVNIASGDPITVAKTGDTAAKLMRYVDGGGRTLSPSAFNAYLDCPLKFYFRAVAGLKISDEVTEEVDVAMFGDILHKAMELLYQPLQNAPDVAGKIAALIGSPRVAEAVDGAVSAICFGGEPFTEEDVAGNILLVRDIVRRYLNNNILPHDSRMGDFRILKTEERLRADFGFTGRDGQPHIVSFGGLADRVDDMGGGRIRIVDYKTGSPHKDFASIGALLGEEYAERNAAALQTFLYSLMASGMQREGKLPGTDVCPSLYYVRMMNDEAYSPLLNCASSGVVESYHAHSEELEEALREKLAEVFDPATPFVQCADPLPCTYCDFNAICRRK